MTLRQQIQEQMKQAMRDKAKVRLESLRFLWSEIKNVEIDAKVELNDEAIQAVITKEVKKRKDAIEQMEAAGRTEMVSEEQSKLAIFMEFMPEQMGREELEEIVNQLIGELVNRSFGEIMGQVMSRVKGKADGKLVQEVVREKLG